MDDKRDSSMRNCLSIHRTFEGQWPYQNDYMKKAQTYSILFILTSFNIFQVAKIFNCDGKFEIIVEVIPPIITITTCTIKLCTLYINRDKLRGMLDQIMEEWRTDMIEDELEIMHHYAQLGRFYTLGYSSYVYFTLVVFLSGPFVPPLLDIIKPLNESRQRQSLVLTEYFVDPDKYFFPITCHQYLGATFAVTILIAADAMFIVYIQHACKMFAIAGYRMEHMICDDDGVRDTSLKEYYLRANKSFDSHMKAIKFACMLESCYSMSYLFQMGLNLICMSVTLVQVTLLMNKSTDVVRHIVFFFGQLIHVFWNSYPGQLLIDHSSRINLNAYNSHWYEAPIEIQKLMILVIRRGAEPNFVSAGKMYILGLESFSVIVQSSMSYFTILSSMQKN